MRSHQYTRNTAFIQKGKKKQKRGKRTHRSGEERTGRPCEELNLFLQPPSPAWRLLHSSITHSLSSLLSPRGKKTDRMSTRTGWHRGNARKAGRIGTNADFKASDTKLSLVGWVLYCGERSGNVFTVGDNLVQYSTRWRSLSESFYLKVNSQEENMKTFSRRIESSSKYDATTV